MNNNNKNGDPLRQTMAIFAHYAQNISELIPKYNIFCIYRKSFHSKNVSARKMFSMYFVYQAERVSTERIIKKKSCE